MITIWQNLWADILSVCHSIPWCHRRSTNPWWLRRTGSQTLWQSQSRRIELGLPCPIRKKSHLKTLIFEYFSFSYGRVGILVLDFEHLHGTDHGLHGHEDVLKDQLNESSLVLIRITGSMDDAHLFNERGFPRFSGTCIGNAKLLTISYHPESLHKNVLRPIKDKNYSWYLRAIIWAPVEHPVCLSAAAVRFRHWCASALFVLRTSNRPWFLISTWAAFTVWTEMIQGRLHLELSLDHTLWNWRGHCVPEDLVAPSEGSRSHCRRLYAPMRSL